MLKVNEWMSTPVQSLQENDSIHSARTLMDVHRIRHIPIISTNNEFVGLVTHRDILSATISQLAELDSETQREIDANIPLREIMRTGVMTTTPEMSLKEAARVLLNNKYGCLPVLDGTKLVGILTEADFLKLTINLLEAVDDNA